MADLDLQEIHDTMVAVAREAGRMILEANPTDIDTGTKLNCKLPPPAVVRPNLNPAIPPLRCPSIPDFFKYHR